MCCEEREGTNEGKLCEVVKISDGDKFLQLLSKRCPFLQFLPFSDPLNLGGSSACYLISTEGRVRVHESLHSASVQLMVWGKHLDHRWAVPCPLLLGVNLLSDFGHHLAMIDKESAIKALDNKSVKYVGGCEIRLRTSDSKLVHC